MGTESPASLLVDPRPLMEKLPGRAYLISPDHRVLFANQAARSYLGRDPIGERCHLALQERSQVCEECRLDRVLAGEAILDEPFRQPDGSWHLAYHYPLLLIDGQPIKLTVVSDVTEGKQAELELRQSEERYRQLIANLDDSVFWLDRQGVFTYISEAITRFSGYKVDEVVGHSFAEFLHPDDLARKAEEFQRCLAGEHVVSEFRVHIQDGSERVVRTSSRPVYQDDQVIGASGVMTDLTDLRRAERDKRSLEEQLRHSQKMEALGRLAGGVAHDFNNLLFVIINHAQFLRQDSSTEASGQRHAVQIEKAAERGAELTRSLLQFSRRRAVKAKVLDLNEMIADMQDMLERILGEDVQLETCLASGLDRVEADPANISQVLLNLVANARDAMPTGGRLRIETSRAQIEPSQARLNPELQAGAYTVLAVSDSGTGMSNEVRERAFEPFFTTRPGGRGTGLGLSTVYSAVHQAGGTVDLESAPGRGTTVKVFLPRTEAWPTITPARPIRPLPRIKGQTVLVVEDEGSVRDLVGEMLRKLGAEVIEAADPHQALRLAAGREAPIHLLVTDVRMPGMSGLQLAAELLRTRPDIRVLYISGWAGEDEDRLGGARAALLHKPFRPEDLVDKLHVVLDRPA